MSRKLIAAVICITFGLLTTGCADSTFSAQLISDADSIAVTSSDAPSAKRIIALANGSAEIIAGMGLQSFLVGRDIASTATQLAYVPIATSGHQVIPERIFELQPDLLLIDNTTGPAKAIATVQGAGIRVVLIDEAWAVADIAKKVTAIAQAIGADSAGLRLNQAIAAKIGAIQQVRADTKIAFLYLRGGSAIYLLGGQGAGADDLIARVGAIDVGAARYDQPFTPISSEALISTDPDIILVMQKGLASVGGVAGLIELPGIAQTTAGKNGAVIAVDDSLLLSFGPRTPDLLERFSKVISELSKR